MKFARHGLLGIGVSMTFFSLHAEIDENGNQQSDVWEMIHGAQSLPLAGDADGDGWTNGMESAAATDPLDASSFPMLHIAMEQGLPQLFWSSEAGKEYSIWRSGGLENFVLLEDEIEGTGEVMEIRLPQANAREFFRMQVKDRDADGDGVSDWEELALGFDHQRQQSGRVAELDGVRVRAGLVAANVIEAAVYDEECAENWPDAAVLVVRRSGGLQPLEVAFSLGGTAQRDVDYTSSVPGYIARFAAGQREVFIEIQALSDSALNELTETVTLNVLTGAGYGLGAVTQSEIRVLNATPTSGPSAKEAARFLIQAAFGPDQDSAADSDMIPENVEELMAQGFEAWIDEQLQRPVGALQPMVEWQMDQPGSAEIYNDRKQNAWWGRAMGLPQLYPGAPTTQLPDPLRQRVGFALSQIFVISDRMERLAVEPVGMANFYDRLLQHSFGNYRDLLREVSLHPCIGIYLSHLGNKKADPVEKTFPDENYAREVMQLFSIGLWMLNPDGSHMLDSGGQPIPTYNNANITELARVFTGLSYGQKSDGSDNLNFEEYNGDFTSLMKGWDEHHDLGPKTLLLGATTPQRTASAGNAGVATMADVEALMDNLFQHPNVGPFLGKQLIQRLVTSNPSSAYVGRVTAAFNQSPRGDMGRVVKAILLDPEARNGSMMADPTFGKLREPFLKTVNVARTFNATAPNGWYYLDAFHLDHVQEPLKAPSVFNFYLPHYSPPGVLAAAELVAPEFQIINASSGVTAPNYFWGSITGGLHRWGASTDKNVTLNLAQEMLLNVPAAFVDDPFPNVDPFDPDPLIRRLDLVLTGGTLSPESFQIIREALQRVGRNSAWEWPRSRLKLAIYLIVSSPEFAVQH